MLYEEFRVAVQALAAESQRPGLLALPALRERFRGESFDLFVLRLQQEGVVHLLTHPHSDLLTDAERGACVVHHSGARAYWLRWA